MFNRKYRGPYFGQRKRGKVYINPQSGEAGTIFYVNVSEFNPSSRVLLTLQTPQNKTLSLGEYELDENGNIKVGYLKLDTKDYVSGKYTIEAHGHYNKSALTSSRKFEIE